MKNITKKLRETADRLHDKAARLDDAHKNEQILDIVEDLRQHSKEIEVLAEQLKGHADG